MILQLSLVIGLGVLGVVVWRFLLWKRKLTRQLNKNSFIARTAKGSIEYQIHGDKGEFVLFLHGSPGGYDQYAIHRNEFFDNYRVISISRFGYLRTPLSYTNLPDQADAIAALLETFKLHRVNVMAGSGGGPLALAFAAYHPEKVRRLILYATVSQAKDLDDNRPGVRLLRTITHSDFLSWLFFPPLMRKPEKFVSMLIRNEENRERIIAQGLAPQFARSISAILPPSLRNTGLKNDERIIKQLDIPKEKITAPTLIIHGDKDEHVTYQDSVLLQQQIAHAKLITIEGGDHFAGYLHNDYLGEVYTEFFSETEMAAV